MTNKKGEHNGAGAHDAATEADAGMQRGADFASWVSAGALLIAALLYGAFLQGSQFVWDDVPAVSYNSLLKTWGGLWDIWTTHGDIPNEAHYWPATYSAMWLQYRFFGESAFGFRAVSLSLHLANALLISLLAQRLGLGRLAGAFALALFALHPIQAESAITTIEQKDLIALFLSLGAAHLYLWATMDRAVAPSWLNGAVRANMGGAVLLLFWGAMWSKSVAVMLPPSLLLMEWWRSGQSSGAGIDARTTPRWRQIRVWMLLGPLFLAAVVLGLLDMKWTQPGTPVDFGLSFFQKIANSSLALVFYAFKLALPFRITTIYPAWVVDINHPVFGVAITLVVGTFAGLAWLAFRPGEKAHRGPLVAAIIFTLAVFPTLGFLELSTLRFSWVANRFIYWGNSALAILFGALGAALFEFLRKREWEWAFYIPVAILFSFYLLQSGYQAWRLQTNVRLWATNLPLAPASPHVYSNYSSSLATLGADFGRAGKVNESYALLKEAEKHWETAFALIRENGTYDPFLEGDIAANLGQTHQKLGDYRRAVRFYLVAQGKGRASLATLNNLAWLLATAPDANSRDGKLAMKMLEEAEAETNGAQYSQVLDTRAAVLAELGEFSEALLVGKEAWTLAQKEGNPQLAREIEGRLLLYRKKQPYRLPARVPSGGGL